MLLVKTKLGLSKIHGIGLLADEFIAKDTVIWRHNDIIDRVYAYSQLANIPEPAQSAIRYYGWREGNYLIWAGDNARFVNHSTSPNCQTTGGGVSVAIKDIQAGEEIVEDYKTFDEDFDLYAAKLTNEVK